MSIARVLTACSICNGGELGQMIDGWIRNGRYPQWISDQLKESGQYISRPTISRHKNHHMTSAVERERRTLMREQKEREAGGDGQPKVNTNDLAAIVVDKVKAGLLSGTLEPNIKDGLGALKIIEDRAARRVDQDLMLQLVGALSGAWTPMIVEGEYREIDAEAIADAEEFRLLGSGA